MTTGIRQVRAAAPHALPRALAATALALVGAVAAHTWAGGELPTWPGLALVAAALTGCSLLAVVRDVPTWAMLPVVALAQLGVHESFGLVDTHGHGAPMPGMTQMTGMTGAGEPGGAGWTWRMVAAHLFVTVLTALLWWAGRRAAAYVLTLLTARPLPVAPRLRRRPDAVVVPRRRAHLLLAPLRGPPLSLPAA